MLWLKEKHRASKLEFRTRILACAGAAATLPFFPLVAGGTPFAILAATLIGAGWFLFCITRLLLPLRDAAQAIDACARGEPLPRMAIDQDDELGRMMANIRLIAARLGNEPFRATASASVPRFEPIVDLTSARVTGADMHWDGALSVETALAEACRQLRSWDAKGLPGLSITLPLSPRDLRDPALGEAVARSLAEHALAPDRIELAWQEEAAFADPEASRSLFARLRGIGVGIGVAGFGGGATHLGQIGTLGASVLKLDRDFIVAIVNGAQGRAVGRAVIELARGLPAAIIACGVETRDEVELLREIGCARFQGPYFAAPLEADAFLRALDDPNWLGLLASPVHRELAGLRTRIS